MADRLSGLPAELLEMVFLEFDTIDDVLALGTASKYYQGCISNNKGRYLKSAIEKNPKYKADIVLCHVQDAYSHFATEYTDKSPGIREFERHIRDRTKRQTSSPTADSNDDDEQSLSDLSELQLLDRCILAECPPSPWRPTVSDFTSCFESSYDPRITDEDATRIYHRRIGLKPFIQLYEDKHLKPKYLTAPYPYEEFSDDEEWAGIGDIVAAAARQSRVAVQDVPDPTTIVPHMFRKDNFLCAIVHVWLSIEVARLARTCAYTEKSDVQNAVQKVEKGWKGVGYCNYRASLEQLEVYDFIYGFLVLQTQLCGQEPKLYCRYRPAWMDRYDYNENYKWGDVEPGDWGENWGRARYNLTPADVLELLSLTSSWKREAASLGQAVEKVQWSRARCVTYMRVRGAFDRNFPRDFHSNVDSELHDP